MEARLAAYTTVCAPRRAAASTATQPQLTGGAKLHSSKGETSKNPSAGK